MDLVKYVMENLHRKKDFRKQFALYLEKDLAFIGQLLYSRLADFRVPQICPTSESDIHISFEEQSKETGIFNLKKKGFREMG